MKKYNTLLFDIDNTLLDFGAAESAALQLLFESYDLPLTAEMEANYKSINRSLWEQYEEGKIDREVVLNTRFSKLFRLYGKTVDGVKLEESYRHYLGQGTQLMEGALDVITTLYENYPLYVVTNGVSKTQDQRLRKSGLFPYFKDIFVSEDTGYQKPMKEYFAYVFARIPHFDPSKALIIGDSLNADIKGGMLAGLDTCWINPEGKPNTTDVTPTYEINRLSELFTIVS